MRKILVVLCIIVLSIGAKAQFHKLGGFTYANEDQPKGNEWEQVDILSLNKEQPRAWFFNFKDLDNARMVLPQYSEYYKSLDGIWKFNWVNRPEKRPQDFYKEDYNVSNWDNIEVPSCWNVVGIQKDGSLKYGTPIYVNQQAIFAHRVEVGDWKKGIMRTPAKDWTTYEDRNEVGSYKREFEIPADWNGRKIYINFDGVNSFHYLWINGKYVGFSVNSRNTATYDITKYIKEGKNQVAVEVYRISFGSFLESQDMYRLPGIFRSVYLSSSPKVEVKDWKIIPSLKNNYTDGVLDIQAELHNDSNKKIKNYTLSYKLYQNNLYTNTNRLVADNLGEVKISKLEKDKFSILKSKIEVSNPSKWSAEEPNLYTLVGELKDKKGNIIQRFSTNVGFRMVEIKDTKAEDDEFHLAGRYYYINGKTVKLKGVNRQEINPSTGSTISAEQIEMELQLMKRLNINQIRTSHYSNMPIFYYLCNLYGIYVEDEANIESHHYYYGKESLSHVPEFKNAHVARVMEAVGAHINFPSVVMWSLGNEAGPGINFVHAYNALKDFDTSRPVQYERNNDIVDMGSDQYPSVDNVRAGVTGRTSKKYPFHISEYAHSMGNAGGDLADYWEAIESTNFYCGAAIWDWVDQSLYNYDSKTGQKYLAYGGDFSDKPNSGMFCMNGILFPDFTPKPEAMEVKKVYQNLSAKWKNEEESIVEIFNKRYFTDLSDLYLEYSLVKDGEIVNTKSLELPQIKARSKADIKLDLDKKDFDKSSEYFVNLEFKLKNKELWADKGFVQMFEQLKYNKDIQRPSISEQSQSYPSLSFNSKDDKYFISGKDFNVVFDNQEGSIYSLSYNDQEMISAGNGPKPDLYRAFTDNDKWIAAKWIENGLQALKHRALKHTVIKNNDGSISISYTVKSQAETHYNIKSFGAKNIFEANSKAMTDDDFYLITEQIWTVYKDGSIEINAYMDSNKPKLAVARLGYSLKLNKSFDKISYYGRGPENNYSDRKSGYPIGLYQSSTEDMIVHFPKPQSMGNREEVRWLQVGQNRNSGLLFVGAEQMSISVLPWSAMQLCESPHFYQLPESDGTYIHLDQAASGLGGASCGPIPQSKNQVFANGQRFSFIIRNFEKKKIEELTKIKKSGIEAIAITRDKKGVVSIDAKGKKIYFSIDNGKKQEYKKAFVLKRAAVINAYYADMPELIFKKEFIESKSNRISVISLSSFEQNEGEADNMLDNDPSTYWHSNYSLTEANYPHWIIFELNDILPIESISYLARQRGSVAGDVKDFIISVSKDNKEWKEVYKGSFPRSKRLNTIVLSKGKNIVKAKYVKFTAINSQDGSQICCCAEFDIKTM